MYAHYGLLAISAVALGLGLFMMLKPDAMWRFTQWRNRAAGIATSERSTTWERSNRIVAFIVILAGLGAAFGFWQFEQIVAEERARRDRARDVQRPSLAPLLEGPTKDP